MDRLATKIQVQKNITFTLLTTLLIALESQAAVSFTIEAKNGATYYYNPKQPYFIDNKTSGVVRLNPRIIAGIKPSGFKKFNKFLDSTVDSKWLGWSFTPANKELYGSFEVNYYYICSPQTSCATGSGGQNQTLAPGVGAYIDVRYHPTKTDPEPSKRKLYWIQFIVKTNHSRYTEDGTLPPDGQGVHGIVFQGLDIPLNQAQPYFINKYIDSESGKQGFYDRPFRLDPNQKHYWYAETYLVEEVAPKTVVVYNGIKWGWENRIYPNNSCPNPNLRTVSGETNITPSNSVDSMDALQELNCPPPPPPYEPSPPPPNNPPPPPYPDRCYDSGDPLYHSDFCNPSAPTGIDKVSKISWGFGVGSDYLL